MALGLKEFPVCIFKSMTWIKKGFAFTRLLPPSNSKTKLGERELHLTDGKTEAK